MPKHLPQPTSFELCHRIPGRLRLRIPALLDDATLGTKLLAALRTLDGVRIVRINPTCGSVIIEHRTTQEVTSAQLALVLDTVMPAAVTTAPVRFSKPLNQGVLPSPRPARVGAAPAKAPCVLCQMKLAAARWILADVWRCWQRQLGERMRTLFTSTLLTQRQSQMVLFRRASVTTQ